MEDKQKENTEESNQSDQEENNEKRDLIDAGDLEKIEDRELDEDIIIIDEEQEESEEKDKKFDRVMVELLNDIHLDEKDVYEEVKKDYPLFHQVSNGCGLSSMLMLLDPIKENKDLAEFIDTVWEGVKTFLMAKKITKKEFKWSYALQYLLQKALHKNVISNYLRKNIEYFDDDFIPHVKEHLMELKQAHINREEVQIVEMYDSFFKNGLNNHFIVQEHLGRMKTNVELRILFELFGYEFIPHYYGQPTMALWFSQEEIKSLDDSVSEKAKILKTEFERGSKVMWGQSYHWLAVTDIQISEKGYEIIVNDPLIGQKLKIKLQSLTSDDQLYFYKKKNVDMKPIWKSFVDYLEKEFEKERKVLENFKKELQKGMLERIAAKKSKTEISKEDLVEIPRIEVKPSSESEKLPISEINVFLNLNKNPAISKKEEEFKDNIKKVIRSRFSNYDDI